MKKLTQKEAATNHETWKHINRVQQLMNVMIQNLQERALNHDQSKLESPEVELFAKYTDKLAECEYGSEEYEEYLKELAPALEHHYANNRHHPEHYPNGINDMNLLDLLEMFCDWKASSERQNNGNIRRSIEKNATRFDMSEQLEQIFENTINILP